MDHVVCASSLDGISLISVLHVKLVSPAHPDEDGSWVCYLGSGKYNERLQVYHRALVDQSRTDEPRVDQIRNYF